MLFSYSVIGWNKSGAEYYYSIMLYAQVIYYLFTCNTLIGFISNNSDSNYSNNNEKLQNNK